MSMELFEGKVPVAIPNESLHCETSRDIQEESGGNKSKQLLIFVEYKSELEQTQ